MAEKIKTKVVQAMTFREDEPVVQRTIKLDEKGNPVIEKRGKYKFYVTVD